LIFTEDREVTKLREEVKNQERAAEVLVNGLTAEYMMLKKKVQETGVEIAEIKKQFRSILQQLLKLTQERKWVQPHFFFCCNVHREKVNEALAFVEKRSVERCFETKAYSLSFRLHQ
jgi:flagellar biosynthesis/type III secretory pathway chaperone